MKKNDIFLGVGILAVAAIFFFVVQGSRGKSEPGYVVASIGSQEYARYPLDKDGTYEIETYDGYSNLLEIKDGVAKMIEANCSDQICVHQAAISKNGDLIVCLPHELILQVEGSEENTKDAVAN